MHCIIFTCFYINGKDVFSNIVKNYTLALTHTHYPLTHRKQVGVYCYAKHSVITLLGVNAGGYSRTILTPNFLKKKAIKSEINCCICVFVLFRKKNHFWGSKQSPRKKFLFSMRTLYKFSTKPIVTKNKVTSNADITI